MQDRRLWAQALGLAFLKRTRVALADLLSCAQAWTQNRCGRHGSLFMQGTKPLGQGWEGRGEVCMLLLQLQALAG